MTVTRQNIELPRSGAHLYESKHNDKDVVNEHHHPVHQILYAIEGQGQITVDGYTQHVVPDDVAIFSPFSNHSIISSSRLTLLILAFNAEALRRLFRTKSSLAFTINPASLNCRQSLAANYALCCEKCCLNSRIGHPFRNRPFIFICSRCCFCLPIRKSLAYIQIKTACVQSR